MDPETHGDAHAVALLQVCAEGLQGRDDPEPGMHSALGVVFVRLRVAKVDQQAITKILGNVAVEALDDLRTGALVGAHDRTQVFRIKLAGEAGGLHQVTEQDGELAPLGLIGRRCRWGRGRWRWMDGLGGRR